MIIDVVAILMLALLLVRGWWRGFVREAMDLVGLILGTVLAFRLAPFMGGTVNAVFDVSEPVARLIGGSIVLMAVGIALAIVTRAIDQKFQLPGLNLINRASGAGLAAAWGCFLRPWYSRWVWCCRCHPRSPTSSTPRRSPAR